MKNLYDIYEDGAITSTPGNTVGMGNPMLPTAEEPGTEPLITAKYKKDKKKCKKIKEDLLDNIDNTIDNLDNNDLYEDISEGLLSDIDTTMSEGGIITEFADWFVEGFIGDYPGYKKDKTKYLNVFVQCLSTEGNNTIIIDLEKLDDLLDSTFSFFDGTTMYMATPMPSNIKEVKVYNTSNFYINSYIGDISNFNIKVYEDEGNYYGSLLTSFKLKCKDIKFGTIECSELKIRSIKAETVYLEKNSTILEIDVASCNSLTEIYNGESALSNITHGKYNLTYIKHQLHKARILPWGSGLTINYMTKNITIK